MQARLVVTICASVAALVVAAAPPAAASACSQVAKVNSYHGQAHMGFDAQASGPDEPGQPQYGTETISLFRSLASVNIDLTHKLVVRNRFTGTHVFFSGKASGGDVTIKDTFDDTIENTSHATVSYNGPLKNAFPANFGQAALIFDLDTCQYQLTVSFGVKTQFSGDQAIEPGDTASGGADSHRKHIPASLKLSGVAAPDAYQTCPDNPLVTGKACYAFGGGWTNDFLTLKECHSTQAVDCGPSDQPVGVATFAWHLSPAFKKKFKKK